MRTQTFRAAPGCGMLSVSTDDDGHANARPEHEEHSMTNYLLIYRADPAAMAAMPEPTPEQGAEMMDAWNNWAARAGDAIVNFGDPTVAVSPGADPTVGGYSILQADSYDEIAALLEGHPHTAMGGTIDVYETQPVLGG